MKSVGVESFYECAALSRITLSKSLVEIGLDSFIKCTALTSVTIPASVNTILERTFADCVNLEAVYFAGNAPNGDSTAFSGDNSTIVFYLPGTTGWGTTYLGRPAVLWNPRAETAAAHFGISSNKFGFPIVGPTNVTVVVEATANLAQSIWSPVSTNFLIGGSSYFSDPQWTNYPSRFYRLRSP